MSLFILAVGLWPKIPLNIAGNLIDPAISDPIPIKEAPDPNRAPYKIFFYYNIF